MPTVLSPVSETRCRPRHRQGQALSRRLRGRVSPSCWLLRSRKHSARQATLWVPLHAAAGRWAVLSRPCLRSLATTGTKPSPHSTLYKRWCARRSAAWPTGPGLTVPTSWSKPPKPCWSTRRPGSAFSGCGSISSNAARLMRQPDQTLLPGVLIPGVLLERYTAPCRRFAPTHRPRFGGSGRCRTRHDDQTSRPIGRFMPGPGAEHGLASSPKSPCPCGA